MGTTAQKLQAVVNSKAAIKAAIEAKGVADVGDVLSAYPDKIASISSGGWTGHADEAGLKAIGWTDDDIAYYQKHGVNWNEEDDKYHLVPEDNKALYGVINIDNIENYKDILVYMPKIDTSSVTNMSKMFYDCYSLVSVPLFDTSSVTTMGSMFYNCYSLVSVPLFNTSSVTGMYNMFYNCYSLVSVPLFNTSSVTNMSMMFQGCYSLVSVPLFNTSSVTDMSMMFQGCYSLVSVPLFNTSSVIEMGSMFYNCYSLVSVPLFNTSSVTIMSSMFYKCTSLVYCNLKNLKLYVGISETSLLEKSSLLYMIENAAPTSTITIKLSAYCYNKYRNDPDVVAALSAQPLIKLASA